MCRNRAYRISLIVILGLALTGAAHASIVGWWKFDGNYDDASGNGNNGAPIGTPTFAEGRLGQAVNLNATGTDQCVECGMNTGFTTVEDGGTADGMTLAVWINRSTTAGDQKICGNLTEADWAAGHGFQWGIYNNVLELDMRDSVNRFFSRDVTPAGSGPTFVANTWYHVAFVFDDKANTLQEYINCVPGRLWANVARSLRTSTTVFRIGGETPSNTNGRAFRGLMDDLRMYDMALSTQQLLDAMNGLGPAEGLATTPDPADQATDVIRDVVLGWRPGKFAARHDVYFGTDFNDVNSASTGAPSDVLVNKGQEAATYDPAGLLDFGRTYYWRVDEVNTPDRPGTYKGNVWSFTSEPYGYPIRPIRATASSVSNPLTGPDKTIGGSGLDALDQHSTSGSQMWLSKKNTTPIWIQYEFDRPYKLYQMWVWNQNQLTELDFGFGAKDVTIETSTDGVTWTALEGVPEFAQAPGETTYTHNTTVDFGGVLAQYVKLTLHTNWADGDKQAGLSEVRFFYIPLKAFGPAPASGAAGVALDGVLNWRPGREAAGHEVYLGTDPNAPAKVGTVTEHRYDLGAAGIEYDRTYYWKVNEVNDAASPTSWTGDVWSFMTPVYSVVDDFESYDDACKRIYYAWIDGAGHNGSAECEVAPAAGTNTGSTVGNPQMPYAERTIIHTGRQSMPMAYNGASEAVRTFDAAQDWTRGGATTLVLFFYGLPTNAVAPLYVKIDGTQVAYNGSAGDIARRRWTQWNIDLKSSGASLKAVKTLTLGVGSGGSGTIYVDDIRLYRTAPAVLPPVDPGTTDLMASYAMENSAQDGSGKGNNGTLVGAPLYVQGQAGYGMAMQFDGTVDCVDLGNKAAFNPTGSLSISVWANIATWTTDWGHIMVGNRGEDSLGWQLRRRNSNKFCFTTRGVGEDDLGSNLDAPVGEWVHIAAVYDNVNNTKRIYINGMEDAVASTTAGRIAATTHNTYIGARATAANDTQEGFFSGLLDEIHLYSRPLSGGEIRYLAGDR